MEDNNRKNELDQSTSSYSTAEPSAYYQGEDHWPSDPEELNRELNSSNSEIWLSGSNYVMPSKWQECKRKTVTPGYFNHYQSGQTE